VRKDTLGILYDSPACVDGAVLYAPAYHARVIELVSRRYRKTYYCGPVRFARPDMDLYKRVSLDQIEVIPQPYYARSIDALRHPLGLARAYLELCQRVDVVFVRGMIPFVMIFYLAAWLYGCRVAHWIVGDPISLLGSHKREGRLKDTLGVVYAWIDRLCTRIGRWLTDGTLLCNGRQLAAAYPSPRTRAVVSSTVRPDDIRPRRDTCNGECVRILLVSYIRPEKGVEYLIEALGRLATKRPWELVILGSSSGYEAYRRRLDELIERLGLAGRIRWVGLVRPGPAMWRYYDESDIFVLPTLSEGTPHVVSDARARSLPVITTSVGGIPTFVRDEVDGILVPPGDADALARAIDRVIEDAPLRRRLIAGALEAARRFTLDNFVEIVWDSLTSGPSAATMTTGRAPVEQG